MKTTQKNIEGPLTIELDVFVDERGFFMENFQEKRYQEVLGSDIHFVQDNFSQSKKGVLRGLHYQVPPFDIGKLVAVFSGRGNDVAVDIRFGSSTFGQHVAVELSAENHKQFWIPSGFAHSFVTDPIVSEKDQQHPLLKDIAQEFTFNG